MSQTSWEVQRLSIPQCRIHLWKIPCFHCQARDAGTGNTNSRQRILPLQAPLETRSSFQRPSPKQILAGFSFFSIRPKFRVWGSQKPLSSSQGSMPLPVSVLESFPSQERTQISFKSVKQNKMTGSMYVHMNMKLYIILF